MGLGTDTGHAARPFAAARGRRRGFCSLRLAREQLPLLAKDGDLPKGLV